MWALLNESGDVMEIYADECTVEDGGGGKTRISWHGGEQATVVPTELVKEVDSVPSWVEVVGRPKLEVSGNQVVEMSDARVHEAREEKKARREERRAQGRGRD